MRSFALIALALAGITTHALADPPPTVTPVCTQFGTETGFLCSFTRRVDLSWVCTEFGFSTGQCAGAYSDCQVKLIWWPGADYDEPDASVNCTTPVLGT